MLELESDIEQSSRQETQPDSPIVSFSDPLGDSVLLQRVRSRLFGEAAAVTFGTRYRVIRRLGAGAVGVVYLAADTVLDRDVALKIIPQVSSGDFARLRREAKLLASVRHQNVVSVYDVGSEEEQVYIAMEYVAGGSLDDWLERPLERDWRKRLDIALSVGNGLLAIHERGLVHRDLKPANILLDENNVVKVADFGLAKRAMETPNDGSVLVTNSDSMGKASLLSTQAYGRADTFAGTPLYMAPEAYEGIATPRSDQYAFSIIVHEILFGRLPDGLTGRGMLPVDVAKLNKSRLSLRAPRVFRSIIGRGMHLDAQQRWPSLSDYLRALRQAQRARAWSRRAVLAGSAVALAATGVLGFEYITNVGGLRQAEMMSAYEALAQRVRRYTRVASALAVLYQTQGVSAVENEPARQDIAHVTGMYNDAHDELFEERLQHERAVARHVKSGALRRRLDAILDACERDLHTDVFVRFNPVRDRINHLAKARYERTRWSQLQPDSAATSGEQDARQAVLADLQSRIDAVTLAVPDTAARINAQLERLQRDLGRRVFVIAR
ncbi:MAG: serine/threonine protein kinase [Myxococcales bacterium FL481]|nr:MAG: serine/threonine protein kinase [Myxococcales bacterium FL481]